MEKKIKYKCEICGFFTHKKHNIDMHNKSKKHKLKYANIIIDKLEDDNNLLNQYNKELMKINKKLLLEGNTLKKQFKKINNNNEYMKKEIELLNQQTKSYLDMINDYRNGKICSNNNKQIKFLKEQNESLQQLNKEYTDMINIYKQETKFKNDHIINMEKKIKKIKSEGVLYITQPREFVDTKIYKIGRTCGLDQRDINYGKDNEFLYYSNKVDDIITREKFVKRTLYKKTDDETIDLIHRDDIGDETFEGDIKILIECINTWTSDT
jgi:hypothetical protein